MFSTYLKLLTLSLAKPKISSSVRFLCCARFVDTSAAHWPHSLTQVLSSVVNVFQQTWKIYRCPCMPLRNVSVDAA